MAGFYIEPYSIGRGSYVGECTHIAQYTTIGNYCSIANLCTIGARPHDLTHLTTYPLGPEIKGHETVIGHDVWIGCNAVILAGLKVGTGAVIGAGAVVTRDIPPYAIVAGNPAKVLRYRFPEEIRNLLLESKWWELTEEQIKVLPLEDPAMCLEILKNP